MKLIGHSLAPYEPLFWCDNFEQIWAHASENVLFKFNGELIKKAAAQNLHFSIQINDITQLIIANACGAKFIIVPKILAKQASKIAQKYLFDSQIAVIIDDEKDLLKLAKSGVDAAIFKEGILNGNF